MVWPLLAAMAGMGAINKFTSTPDKVRKIGTQTPEQQQALSQLFQMLGGGGGLGQGAGQGSQFLSDLLNPQSQAYASMEKPYMQQFEQQTVPGLAERFAGFGGLGGGLQSSGFGQALSSAGGNLQAQLAAMRTGTQTQAANSLLQKYLGGLGLGLGAQAFQPAYQPGNTGLFGPALSSFAQYLPFAMSQGFGGGNFRTPGFFGG